MLRCYSCGNLIPEGYQEKRTVQLGRSTESWSGWGGGWFIGGGTTNHFGEVWMCPACAAADDKTCCVFFGCLGAVVLAAFVLVVVVVLRLR